MISNGPQQVHARVADALIAAGRRSAAETLNPYLTRRLAEHVADGSR